jgi:LEM3 (ligand-effect modulator 3) family / CDC50 family
VSTSFSSSNSTSATQPQWKAIQRVNTDLNITEDVCQIRFTLPTDFAPPVMLYYRLTNFHQNHRRYVKSVDEGQLRGNNMTAAQLNHDGGCTPLIVAPNGKPYYPCGLIANSLFNGNFLSCPTELRFVFCAYFAERWRFFSDESNLQHDHR